MQLTGGLKAIIGALGAVAAVIASFLGMPLVWALGVLVGLMFLDVLSALVAKRGDWDPDAGRLGWRRKSSTVLVILSVALLQGLVEQGVEINLSRFPTAAAIAGGYAIWELGSVLKNAKASGVKWIPDGLTTLFRTESEEANLPVRNPQT